VASRTPTRITARATSGAPKAECVAGARACPPEDCGGADGYEELLEAIADPQHERHAELKEWVGPYFAPEEFDVALVNSIANR
jgi:hypothetical protein